jgi:hypothetical protein
MKGRRLTAEARLKDADAYWDRVMKALPEIHANVRQVVLGEAMNRCNRAEWAVMGERYRQVAEREGNERLR